MFWIWFAIVVGIVAGGGLLYDRRHRGHVRARNVSRPMEGSVGAGDMHLGYGQANITPPIGGHSADH